MTHSCNLSLQEEEEARGSEIQGHPHLHSELEVILNHMRPCLKIIWGGGGKRGRREERKKGELSLPHTHYKYVGGTLNLTYDSLYKLDSELQKKLSPSVYVGQEGGKQHDVDLRLGKERRCCRGVRAARVRCYPHQLVFLEPRWPSECKTIYLQLCFYCSRFMNNVLWPKLA